MRLHPLLRLMARPCTMGGLAVLVLLAHQAGRLGAQTPSPEQAVRDVDDRRVKALIDDDFPALEAILADDLTYGHSNGVLDTKTSYLASLRSGKTKYQTIERAPSTVRLYGDTAVVTGTATVGLRGLAPFGLRYTLVYARRDGQWRMVAWQSTRLP